MKREGPLSARPFLEALEERAQPSATPFPELAVDPSSFDAAALLVHLDESAQPAPALLDWGAVEHLGFGIWKLELHQGVRIEEAWAALQDAPGVVELDLDYTIEISAVTPNDPSFSQQYALGRIDAPEAWEITVGSPTVIVAVIDTGVDYNHVDLAANIWRNTAEIAGNGVDDDGNGFVDDVRGWDFFDDDNNPYDTSGHGTHVAGTIAAVSNNGAGVAGVAWNVQIMPLRFLGPSGGYTSDAVRALNYAVANGASISNNSWGGGGFSSSLQTAIASARNAGHIFVAAAGNQGRNNDVSAHYPSNYALNNIVAVAATTQSDGLASFSNYGAVSVDLGAPGVSILSTTPGNTYSSYSGTSMAAPHVTGALALVRSLRPEWSYQQVINAVLDNVDQKSSLIGRTASGGRLNVFAALQDAAPGFTPPTDPTPPDPPTPPVDPAVPTPPTPGPPPTVSLTLSDNSVQENRPVGATVGTLGTSSSDSYTFTLMEGAGSADNGAFVIVGNQLRTTSVFDFETRNSYTIRVRGSFDGNTIESIFTIAVGDSPYIVSAADAGGGPHLKVYEDGSLRFQFLAFDANFTGGVRVALGDVNGDSVDDIIAAAGPGAGPHVKVFDGRTGAQIRSFFAFNPAYTGGISLAAADFNDDGIDDIVAGMGPGARSRVKIFSGLDPSIVLANFLAYDPLFSGGVSVAAGDINNDGLPDLVTAAGPGGGPHVKAFNGVSSVILHSFFAYDPALRNGPSVAVGDVNGDGWGDIVTAAGPGGGPHVKVFSGIDNSTIHSFFAYQPTFVGGVRVATIGRTDGIGHDIITGAGPDGAPLVKVFRDGQVRHSFLTYDANFLGGLFVAGGTPAIEPAHIDDLAETIEEFELGYATAGWRDPADLDALLAAGDFFML